MGPVKQSIEGVLVTPEVIAAGLLSQLSDVEVLIMKDVLREAAECNLDVYITPHGFTFCKKGTPVVVSVIDGL